MSRPAYTFLLGKSLFFITSLSFCPFGLKIYCRLTKSYHVALLLIFNKHSKLYLSLYGQPEIQIFQKTMCVLPGNESSMYV